MRTLSLLVALPALVASAQAPSAPSVDQLLAKHVEALGGQAKLDGIKSLRLVATIPAGGMEGTLTVERRFPDCMRAEVEIMGQTILTVCNAKGGSTLNPLAGQTTPQALGAPELKAIREGMHAGGALLAARASGQTLESLGLVTLDGGAKAYKVKATAKEGGDSTLYFLDATTSLLIRSEGKRTMMGQTFDTVSTFKDFKQVSGLTFAHTQITEMQGGAVPAQTIEVSVITLNPALDDARFVLEAPKPSAAK
jgi:hypothetical protein